MYVTRMMFRRFSQSPKLPNTMPAPNRAKYGKLASMPALDKLKPSTSFMNFGAPVSRKYSPHILP